MPGEKALQYGARVYFYEDGVVLVKQTVKSAKTGTYVVDTDANGNHRERHVDPDSDRLLSEVVRLAGQGKLKA